MQNMEKRFLEKMKLPDIPKEFEESFGKMQQIFKEIKEIEDRTEVV